MKDEKIIEAMARWEGLEYDPSDSPCGWVVEIVDAHEEHTPVFVDYLTSHDACQRVIEGHDLDDMKRYIYHLMDGCVGWLSVGVGLKATPRQKCAAILKAVGKWED